MSSSEKDSSNGLISFPVHLSFQGKTAEVAATVETTANEMVLMAQHQFLSPESPNHDTSTALQLKLLYKGRRFEAGNNDPMFVTPPTKILKVMVLATEIKQITELNLKKSDATIRGFDNEKVFPKIMTSKEKNSGSNDWGPLLSKQDKNFKFCRFDVCTRQSFGHRPGDTTPHEFEARNLLIKLATDPGIVAIMRDRELIVGTLGEMDPIDDRYMQQTQQQQGVCLLGYNTNGGTRIDLKLRTDDLKTFRPYIQLVSTLVHELSHNWVGDHNLLFWTNYGHMMVDYFATHAFGTSGIYISGQSTGQIAGLPASIRANMNQVMECVMGDLRKSMIQHGLDASVVESLIRQRCDELIQTRGYGAGHVLGGNSATSTIVSDGTSNSAATITGREMALRAAERRQRENHDHVDESKKESSKSDNKQI